MKKVSVLILLFFVLLFVERSSDELSAQVVGDGASEFFEEGVYHFNRRDYISSVNAFMRALYKDPSYYKARYWLGKSYFHSGYIKNALIEWEQVLNLLGGEDYFLRNKIIRLLNQSLLASPSFDGDFVETIDFSSKSLSGPLSIYIDRDGYYWVLGHSSGNVLVFDKNSRELSNLSSPSYSFKHPYDLVQGIGGNFFVSDFGLDKIHILSRDRSYLSSFGSSGIEAGNFMGPSGLEFDSHNNLYVVDKGNHRVQKFNSSGDFLMKFGMKGSDRSSLFKPSDLVVVGSYIYVTDTGNSRVQVFNESGNWVRSIGDNILKSPMGIKSFDNANIFVVDKDKGIFRFSLKDFSHKLIKGLDDNLREPVDMAIDSNNFLYVTDLSRSSILSYVPEFMKYTGLDISVLQTFVSEYPSIVQKVLVKDQLGNYVFGLGDDNFAVYEEDVSHDVIVDTKSLGEDLSLLVVNDKSLAMKSHASSLKKIMSNIFDNMSYSPEIKVINFNKSHWQSQDFVFDKLVSLSSIVDSSYGEGNSIGNALYKGISDILLHKIDLKGGIVLISSGNLDDSSFSPYGYDVCLNYARNNLIPIYVISFADRSREDDILRELAAKTGGEYFHAYSSNNLGNLGSFIKSYNAGIYYVKHKSRFYSKGSNSSKWRDIRLEVRLKDLFGQDRSEYFFYN